MSDPERDQRDRERERMLRELAEEIVIDEAEQYAAGRRRLTVLHNLRSDQRAELDELSTFVDDICRRHGIENVGGVCTSSYLVGPHPRGTRWTRWLFGPPSAVAEIAIVRAALAQRYPHWPIEADDY